MDYRSILEKGQEMYAEGRVGEAERIFKYILEIQPDSVQALNNLGVFEFQRGDHQAAEKLFTSALDIRADDSDTLLNLAGSAPVVHDTHDLISLRSDGDHKLAYFEGIANRGSAGRVYTTPYQLEEARKLYGVIERA